MSTRVNIVLFHSERASVIEWF